MDTHEMKKAYLSAMGYTTEEDLIEENNKLKARLNTLQQRYDMLIISVENSVEAILRIAREGKSDESPRVDD
jgi:hypothetical protein